MAERSISRVKVPSNRTSAGKKVDSWRVELPDGASEITVTMHSSSEGILFNASGTHPAIKGLHWEGTDLMALRAEVERDVEHAARRYYETDWEPAVAVEASLYISDRDQKRSVQVKLDVTDIHRDPNSPKSNRGETRVLAGTLPTVMIERSHDQVFEHSKGLSSENMRFSREAGVTASRAITGSDEREAALQLQLTLEAFSIKLMKRLAPDVVSHEGVPAPEELRDLLQDAIDDPEQEQRDEDEFRM